MSTPLLLCLTLAAAAPPPADGPWPRTKAETTDYRETSTLADVSAFLDGLKARGAPLRVETLGRSAGGREIPLVVCARPMVADAAEARRNRKLVVYVQANIHGGEVEGKEAAQMLLRDVAVDRDGAARLLDRLVLLVVPVYNADGNETFGDGARLRPSQDGPERVGQRPNGASLDLNRDAIKAEAPETRAVLEKVYRAWDPEAMLDLHTTNGTRHGYLLTYAPPLNPNTDDLIESQSRDVLLRAVRERLRRERGWRTFDYGNVESMGGVRGWYSFGQEGRYLTNYAGLRNRIGILSEAASFQPFRTRVEVTLGFVRTVLDELARDSETVAKVVHAADTLGADPSKVAELGVRFEFQESGRAAVPLEKLLAGAKADHRKAPDPTTVEPVDLPVFDRFAVSKTAKVPAAYLIPASETRLVELLKRHGLKVSTLDAPWSGKASTFRITSSVTARNAFQGGRLTRLEGRFEESDAKAAAGSFVVVTTQPLGRLAFHLLEPESLDGAVAWGFVEGPLGVGSTYPLLKLAAPPDARAR